MTVPPLNDPDDLAQLSEADRQRLVQRYAAAIVLLTSLPANGHEAQGDKLISADDVAHRLNLSRDWVYENADTKLAACVVRMPGARAVRFSERKLQKFIDRNAGR
jgi:predicted DNA-binding transcriptional regulator AlpA